MKIKNPPLFPDIGILALVYHQWGRLWMTPHHVLTRLANYFHVVWSEPPHGWRDIQRSVAKRRARFFDRELRIPQGFQLYIPEPWLPRFYRPSWLNQLTFDQRLKHGIRQLERQGCRKFVLYLWHPGFAPALGNDGFDLKLYHIDDEYSFSPTPTAPDARELQILKNVDQVFIVSPRLLERKGGINPHTAFMPEGVEYDLYATPKAEPEDIAHIAHPRIGYTGNLKKQLDWNLLSDLSLRHADWQFVFVGPPLRHEGIEEFIREMSQRKNVHFLGPKSVTGLGCYPQHFDVCIMPYRIDEYTNNIYPLKLHEYLASGQPVVSSPIRSLQDFSDVIALAEGRDDWSHALTHALERVTNCPKAVAARQKIAREHDWSNIISSLAQTVCKRLGPEYSAQFANATLAGTDLPPVEEHSISFN